MYPNFGSGSNQPSAPPPPPSSSSSLQNSGTTRPIGFSSLMSQQNNQSTPYPSGPSSQSSYPSGPPPSQSPYPPGPPQSSAPYNNPYAANTQAQNINNYSAYSLPNTGRPNQPGNPYAQGPPPPSQSANPYAPTQTNNPGYQNPYQAQQSGYPPPQQQPGGGYPPYNQQQQQSYQNPYPYSQQGFGRYPPPDQSRPPYNPQQQQQQQQQPVGGYSPYNQQQQPYQNPYSYPPQGLGGYPPNRDYNTNPSGPPPPQAVNDRIRSIAGRYEISDALAQRLNILQQFEIVVLCDDSGSMNTPVDGTNGTRWDELRSIVQIIIEIGAVFDSNGVDVHFLNRQPMRNVTDARQVVESFSQRPGGLTPLTAALRNIFQSTASQANSDKRLLVFVATDGAPTDPNGNVDVRSLENLMQNERRAQTTYVTFLACTDDEPSVAYLSQWDRTMQNVDVVDDYKTERDEIRRIKGHNFPFSFGDYVVKALLGAVDPQIDSLDESPMAGGYNNNNNYRKF